MNDDIQTPAEPDPKDVCEKALGRFLGQFGSHAHGTIAELTDDEIAAVNRAGEDKTTAREQIKSVLTRAYDRRREAHRQETAAWEAERRRSAPETKADTAGQASSGTPVIETQPVVAETPAAVVETPAT